MNVLERNTTALASHEALSSVPTHQESLPTEEGLLTNLFRSCTQELSRVRAIVGANGPQGRKHGQKLRDVQARLCLFGEAFDNRKLESCIGTEDGLFRSVLSMLTDIGKHLTQARRSLPSSGPASDGNKPDQSATQLEEYIDLATDILKDGDGDGDSDSSDESSSCEIAETPSDSDPLSRRRLMLIIKHIENDVDLLMDLCPILEQVYNAKHSMRASCSHQGSVLETKAAIPYVNVVRDKFPLANDLLVQRLGEANWERHERLRTAGGAEASDASASTSKSQFQPTSLFQDSALGSSMVTKSTASHSSFVSSVDGTEKGSFRVPKLPPNASYHRPFNCPFCKKVVHTVQNRIHWKLHVFADLQAYICTSNDCPASLKTFPSRSAWFAHETSHHLTDRSFRCGTCERSFDDENKFLTHREDHGGDVDDQNHGIAILAAATLTTPVPPEKLRCELCLSGGFRNHRAFRIHVGRHLEEIALCALPPSGDDDTDADPDAGSESSDTSTWRVTPWNEAEDRMLIDARLEGLGWQDIKDRYFPTKASAYACQKRYKRLIMAEEVNEMKCSDPTCEKLFIRKSDLFNHEKTHSRPFKCRKATCKYYEHGFPTEKERDRHINDEHNPHLYGCQHCEFCTDRESELKTHAEKHHNWLFEGAENDGPGLHSPEVEASTDDNPTDTPPFDQNKAMDKLRSLESDFDTDWLPRCRQLRDDPHISPQQRRDKYFLLRDGIVREIVSRADAVFTEGDENVRNSRISLIRVVNAALQELRDAIILEENTVSEDQMKAPGEHPESRKGDQKNPALNDINMNFMGTHLKHPTDGDKERPLNRTSSDSADQQASSPRHRHTSSATVVQSDKIGKKYTRYEIPKERTLSNIDMLIQQATDEKEKQELKQQKRLLRNRQAALESRQRKQNRIFNPPRQRRELLFSNRRTFGSEDSGKLDERKDAM